MLNTVGEMGVHLY